MIQILRDHWLTISILSALLLLTGTGCVADRNRMDCPSDTEEYSVTFNLQVPSMQSSLRSVMTPNEERAIDKIHVFVFKQTPEALAGDDGLETLAYIPEFVVTSSEQGLSTKDLVVRLKKPENTTTELYRLVFIANRDLQGLITSKKIREGMTKNEFRENLAADYSERWVTKSIPMWGETNLQSFDDRNKYDDFLNPQQSGSNSLTRPIHLIRALARVDVGVSLSYKNDNTDEDVQSQVLSNFKIKSVAMYRYATKYSVMATQANSGQQPRPTLPSGVLLASDGNPLSCELSEGKDFIAREIYIPERSAGSSVSDRPCIIIGAYYGENNTTDLTYYRLDFIQRKTATPKDEITPLDILRNHRYNFSITKVLGPGAKTPEDALISEPINIQCDVTVWNEGSISTIAYDGQYMLGVSQDHFKFYREGGTLSAKVQTSWPKGFTIENLPDWITYSISPDGGKKTDEKTVTFKVEQHVTEDRTYPISPEDAENALKAAYVQAGRMRWFLSFEQSKDLNVSIAIYSDPECTQLIEFIDVNQYGDAYGTKENKWLIKDGSKLSAKDAGANVTFYVKTEPNLEPKISTKNYDKYRITPQGSISGGIWVYNVTAPDITENEEFFDHIVSNYEFSIKHEGTGRSASARLVLQQLEYNAIPYYDAHLTDPLVMTHEQFFYLMDGKPRQFQVKANSEYKIRLVSAKSPYGSGSVIEPFPDFREKEPRLSGRPVSVTPINEIENPKLFEGVAVFEISSPLGLFPTREFKIYLASAIPQPEANTYMIKKGSKQGILIPVSRVNTAADYYDRLINHDALIPYDSKKPYPLPPGNPDTYKLNRLDPDDDWTVNIVWTDIYDRSKETKIEKAGLKRLGKISEDYIFVEASDKIGNVLIEIRSGKLAQRNTLWSWHIWIVEDYPTIIDLKKSEVGERGGTGTDVQLMSHLIGAQRALDDGDHLSTLSWPAFGMQYQWGRKDPFPGIYVVANCNFYDVDGNPFLFAERTKGDRQNKGTEIALQAAGATYTMKGSIENPSSIVAHGILWNYEMMPCGDSDYMHGKWVFRYPWNRAPSDTALEGDGEKIDPFYGKTVFDPSPYGFRIMTHAESNTINSAYYNNRLPSPLPGSLFDGLYLDTGNGGKNRAFFAAAQAKNAITGCSLINTTGNRIGWGTGSTKVNTYKRAMGYSIRPVVDAEKFGAEKLPEKKDWKEYLPK